MALGMFDGVHRGHALLVKTAFQMAQQLNMNTAAFTFADHPQEFLGDRKVGLICTFEERRKLLQAAGADVVVVENFADIRDFSPQQFVEFLVKKYHVGGLVCGKDFRFAKDGAGDSETLKTLCKLRGLKFKEVEFVLDGAGEKISSRHIREMLEKAQMQQVSRALGRPFSFEGKVFHGKGLARKWQTPTINQVLPAELTAVARGVYQSRVYVDGKAYNAITNIGKRPTFDDGDFINAETHILEETFSDIERARVELLHFIRPEKKFENEQDLLRQIKKDIETVKEMR